MCILFPSLGLSVLVIVGIVIGIIGALLLGICIALVAICKLQPPPSKQIDEAVPDDLKMPEQIAPQAPNAPQSSPLTRTVPQNSAAEANNNFSKMSQGGNAQDDHDYLEIVGEDIYESIPDDHEGSPLPEYSYARNMDTVMKALMSTHPLRSGVKEQAIPLSSMTGNGPKTNGHFDIAPEDLDDHAYINGKPSTDEYIDILPDAAAANSYINAKPNKPSPNECIDILPGDSADNAYINAKPNKLAVEEYIAVVPDSDAEADYKNTVPAPSADAEYVNT